jgi:hypothetical protein
MRTHLLGNAPVTMILPVLVPMVTMQKCLALSATTTLPKPGRSLEGGGSAPNRFLEQNQLKSLENTHLNTSK